MKIIRRARSIADILTITVAATCALAVYGMNLQGEPAGHLDRLAQETGPAWSVRLSGAAAMANFRAPSVAAASAG